MTLDPAESPPAVPAWAKVRGSGNRIDGADSAKVSAQVEIAGDRNAISFGEGVSIERYAPAGFGATVPEVGPRSDAALRIEGDDNHIEIGPGVTLAMAIVIKGSGNTIRIGRDAYLHGFANMMTDAGTLIVGHETTMVQGSLQVHEPVTLNIGDDCMISSQVFISVSDMHPIHDRRTGERINPGASVEIGDHVWLGLRTMVMKGARIGSGCVTAAGAIVSGDMPADSIVAGAPARVLREGVVWSRELAVEIEAASAETQPSTSFWRRLVR